MNIRLLILCADVQVNRQETHANRFAAEMQQVSMERALLTDQNTHDDIMAHFIGVGSREEDCCSWRGVECIDGTLSALVLTYQLPKGYSPVPWEVTLAWLPHSLEFIHMDAVKFTDTLAIEDLPRGLRYLRMHKMQPSTRAKFNTLNFAALPQRIEEISLQNDGHPVYGFVDARVLPPTLTYCLINNYMFLRAIYVTSESLPACLKAFYYQGKKAKVVSTDGQELDKRYQRERIFTAIPLVYKKRFEDVSMAIEAEIGRR